MALRSTSRIWLAVRPLPETETACGLPGAVSVMVTVAERVPAAVGVKVTPIVQLALGFRVLGEEGQLFDTAKSPAPMATLEIVTGTLPLLLNVMFWLLLSTPITWSGKTRCESRTKSE